MLARTAHRPVAIVLVRSVSQGDMPSSVARSLLIEYARSAKPSTSTRPPSRYPRICA